MHDKAERGRAAHGAYKGGLSVAQAEQLKRLKESPAFDIDVPSDINAGEALFRSIDTNGDGEVTLDELTVALEELGEKGELGASYLLDAADKNNDGVISLQEFMEIQKIVGLSNAVSKMDKTYAAEIPRTDTLTDPTKHIGSRAPKIGNQKNSSFFHSWSQRRKSLGIAAFKNGEDPVSSGSLDDSPVAPARKVDETYYPNAVRNGTSGNINVATIDHDSTLSTDIQQDIAEKFEPRTGQDDSMQPNGGSGDDQRMGGAIHGFKRLFGKAGTEIIEANWSLKPVGSTEVNNAVGQLLSKSNGEPIFLPRHGPAILGAVKTKDCDFIIDIPTISARHARFEVIRDRGQGLSKCVIMDLGSTNGVWVNRAKITPFKEVHLFPGDIICLAEPHISFQIFADSEREIKDYGVAVKNALVLAETLESGAATMGIFAPKLKADCDINNEARKLVVEGNYQGAYMLLLGAAMKYPDNAAIWAQLAGMERQRSRRKMQNSNAATTRAFLRASVECFESETDADARRHGLARVFKTWAQLEFDLRNDGPARILFQKSIRCLEKLSDQEESKMQQGKSFFLWASREWKMKDASVAARLCKRALECDPANPFALTLLGNIKAEIGDYKGAREAFKGALISAKHISALQSWGRMEASLGRLDDARRLFRAALSLDDSNQHVLQAWGVAEANAGRVNAARSLFKQCVGKDNKCRAAWHAWARLEDTAGNHEKARKLYLNVLKLKGKSTKALCALGRLDRLQGKLDSAEQYLRRALKVNAQHAPSLQELANTLREKNTSPSEVYKLEKKAKRVNAIARSQLTQIGYLSDSNV